MKKTLLVAVMALLCFSLVFAAGAQETGSKKGQYVIKTGIGYNDQSLQYKTLEFMKANLEKATDGVVTMEIYHSSTLGDDVAILEGLQLGTVEMFCGTIGPAAQWSNAVKLFDLPFLFTSYAQVDALLDGPIGQEVLDSLKPFGMIGVGYWENGFRQLTNNVRPVRTPQDMVGLKLRTMATPVPLATFKLLGANPTPMNFGEVFTALQQGVVDGQENPWETILANKFYEVQKYATNTGHVYSPFGIIFSQKFWDKLPANYQENVREAVFAARTFNRESARASEQKIIAELRKYMKITILTPEELKPFQELTRPVYDQFSKEIGPELVKKAVDFLASM
ncbi:MAG: TRAP transporter substrate-binding protein [Peptostreptococcaceae bacterium]|nr:TRAP transporter substrate-binding protein [Peptostreptococcaceae bacterium]